MNSTPTIVPGKSIASFGVHSSRLRETQNYYTSVIETTGIKTISARQIKNVSQEIFVANVRLASADQYSIAGMKGESLSPIDVDMLVGDFDTWRTTIAVKYAALFKPPSRIPPPSANDFRILMDLLAQAPYR